MHYYCKAVAERRQAHLVKSLYGNRFSETHVYPHALVDNPVIPATHVIKMLWEIYPEPGEMVFIDELHFFPDAIKTMMVWRRQECTSRPQLWM